MPIWFKDRERALFVKNLGIDVNNLPEDFKKYNNCFYDAVSKVEKNFLIRCANDIYLPFCLKDVKGTSGTDYYNMTFLETFIKCERMRSIIKKYEENPSYYWVDLKQNDSSKISEPLELFKLSDGSFYINGGNNRISFLMIMYLSELSKAKDAETKEQIDKKYTFYAKVKSIPKDEYILGSYSILRLLYENIQFKHIGENPDDYSYSIKIGDLSKEIKTKEELKIITKELCSINNINNPSTFYKRVSYLLTDYDYCVTNVLKDIYPDLEELKNNYYKLKRICDSKEVFDGYDLSKVNDSNLQLFICNVMKDKIVNNMENEKVNFKF